MYTDPKVKRKFEKEFLNSNIKDIPIEYEFSKILRVMQEMYELGHADGYAERHSDNSYNKNRRF